MLISLDDRLCNFCLFSRCFYCSAIDCSSSLEFKSFFRCCILLCHHFLDAKCDMRILTSFNTNWPHVKESGFQNPGNFCLLNMESWVLESGTKLKEFGILLTTGMQNASSTDKYWNQVPVVRNPLRGIKNPRLAALDSFTWGERTKHYNMAIVPAGKSDDSMEWS